MKISIIGAGNVGSLAAMYIARSGLGEIILIDIAKGLARGKAMDMEDAAALTKHNLHMQAGEEISLIRESDIVIITAGLVRKPGMTRENLFIKNAQILKDIALAIKKLTPQSLVMVVTNPLDLMTRLVLETTDFKPQKVWGMGITLDSARFTHFISQELDISNENVEAVVIGSHGEGMLPLPRLSTISGVSLDNFLGEKKTQQLVKGTLQRGAEIVSLVGRSAYFAPAEAIVQMVMAVVKDEKRILGASVYLNGQYGIKDVCIGVPARIGKSGVEQIIELELDAQEKESLVVSAENLKQQYDLLEKYGL